MIIYPNIDYSKMITGLGRHNSKSTMTLGIMMAIAESKLTNKPIEVKFGFELMEVDLN